MKEDVGLELADEEERERARIGLADHARFDGAGEVVGEDADGHARRDLFVLRIERDDERGRVHLHRDRGTDHGAEERDHAAGELAEDDAWIGGRVERLHRDEEVGRRDAAVAHRGPEELLLGVEVAEDGRGRDVERGCDLGQRGRREAARAEGAARGFEDLFAGNARWTAHALVNVGSLTPVCQRPFTNIRVPERRLCRRTPRRTALRPTARSAVRPTKSPSRSRSSASTSVCTPYAPHSRCCG